MNKMSYLSEGRKRLKCLSCDGYLATLDSSHSGRAVVRRCKGKCRKVWEITLEEIFDDIKGRGISIEFRSADYLETIFSFVGNS